MALPTIVLVHGAWHSSACWNKLIPLLSQRGYPCKTVGLATVDDAGTATTADDTARIRTALLAAIEEDEVIILVLHSQAGKPGCAAAAGLGEEARKAVGKTGGVRRLACISAVMAAEEEHGEVIRMLDDPFYWTISPEGTVSNVIDGAHRFYNDMPGEEAEYWAKQLRGSTWPAAPADAAAWREIPVVYMLCENDNALKPAIQEAIVGDLRGKGAKIDVQRVDSSHSPFLSMPEVVAEFIVKAAV